MKRTLIPTLILLSVIVVISGCINGNYTKSIIRNASSQEELDLIYKAESIECPDGEWWYDTFDGVKILDCLNNESISYYSNVIDQLNEGSWEGPIKFDSASLKYTANVSYVGSKLFNCSINETNVYVVNMSLSFSDHCGKLCGLWLNHQRSVIFNENKEDLCVIGDDERHGYMVS